MSKVTGLPSKNYFRADSVESIHNYIRNGGDKVSKYVYTVLAVPLSNRATPFILNLIGTDNKFDHKDCITRYDII